MCTVCAVYYSLSYREFLGIILEQKFYLLTISSKNFENFVTNSNDKTFQKYKYVIDTKIKQIQRNKSFDKAGLQPAQLTVINLYCIVSCEFYDEDQEWCTVNK